MLSPAPIFLEGAPAALQCLTKPALSFLLSPPQNPSVKARPALEQVYLLLGHSEEIFFFVGTMAIYFGRLAIAGLARNLCKTTPRSSHPPTHAGSEAISPVEGFQLHLRSCIYHCPAPGCFWWRGCKKNTPRFARRRDFHPRGGNWVVVLHFFLPLWHLLCPHASVLGFSQQLSNDDSAVRRTPSTSIIPHLPSPTHHSALRTSPLEHVTEN